MALQVGTWLVKEKLDDLPPEQRILAGIGLALVAGAAAGAVAAGAGAAAGAVLVAAGALSIYAVVTGETERESNVASPPDTGAAAPPSGGGSAQQPDPLSDEAPESCWTALARVLACAGTSADCEDPDLAAAAAAYREWKCQLSKAMPNPEGPDYCDLQGPTLEEKAAAVAHVCLMTWSTANQPLVSKLLAR